MGWASGRGCVCRDGMWNSWSRSRGTSPTQLQFPHGAAPWLGSGWDQSLLGMSQLPTLQPCPQSRRTILALHPLEYPILLGRASGEELQELWAPAGCCSAGEGGTVGMLPHCHGDSSCHWVSLGIKLQHMELGWCQRGNVESGQVTKGCEGQVAGAVRSQILAGLEPPGAATQRGLG